MKLFLVLTTLVNIAIIAVTYTPSMMGVSTGGWEKLQGIELLGWIIVLGLPVIAAAGAILPWFVQRSRFMPLFLALLPLAILGTTIYAVHAGLLS